MKTRLDYPGNGVVLCNVGVFLARCSLDELAQYRRTAAWFEDRAPRFCYWFHEAVQRELERRATRWLIEAEPLLLPTTWGLKDYALGLAVLTFVVDLAQGEAPILRGLAHALAEMIIAHS